MPPAGNEEALQHRSLRPVPVASPQHPHQDAVCLGHQHQRGG
ncbi:MAG TPA: hypothetical protein VLS92_01925 [Acidimicrobiia bacterium]|nr:hypothetical protein [Acidimicrobiia bacterium]